MMKLIYHAITLNKLDTVIQFMSDDLYNKFKEIIDNNTNNKSLKYSLSKNKYRAFIVFLMQKYHITSKLGYLLFNIGCKTHELNFSLYDVIDNNGIKSLRALYKEDFNDYVQQTYNNIFYEDFTKWIKDRNMKRIKCYD